MSLLTPDAYRAFQTELDTLRTRRADLVTELARASELGDRSENAAYRVAKQALFRSDRRISYLHKVLAHASLVSPKSVDIVGIGCQVIVDEDGKTYTYRIVDTIQADISKGDISTRSPFGRSLMGKRVGEKVVVTTPRKTRVLLIKDLTYASLFE